MMERKKTTRPSGCGEETALPALRPRDRILRTADKLFYEHGIHSVGIDRIIAESGVAKMTFYRHFPSKSALVAEYLDAKEQSWQQMMCRFSGEASKPALARLLAIFDALSASIQHPDFRGCPFIRALAEFGPERDEPEIRGKLAAHFANGEKFVTDLVKQIRPKDSKKFIQPILSLITGTIVIAQATGSTDIAVKNKESVRLLLAS